MQCDKVNYFFKETNKIRVFFKKRNGRGKLLIHFLLHLQIINIEKNKGTSRSTDIEKNNDKYHQNTVK